MVGFESSPALGQRVMRVFVSSTFRDMQAEREELIKLVFPQLRKLCETRGVTWGEVDLRWGVTDEQKAEGQVLPICLEEVRRCRPYFIGLLGDRYGFVLEDLEPAILSREPWLAAYRGRSVTEIEIVCGVLDDPAMAEHAFFYFRDPSYTVPDEEWDRDASRSGAAGKLAALKDHIRQTDFPVHENYRSARELGQRVLADFTELIDRLFPEGSAPDPLDSEAATHATFAFSRARVYIGRPAYFDRLDAHVSDDGQPLAVRGGSGLGKSALLANWVARYRRAHPDAFVFAHYLGASPASTDWAGLVRRLLGEFNRRYELALPIPDEPDRLRKAFADALRIVGASHRVIIVLDGLNQLDDRDRAPELAWLPRILPPMIRLIVSTLPGLALDAIERRDWRKLEIDPLTRKEREPLIAFYLAQYTKALSPAQTASITAAPLTGNPLFLIALLDELRVWGEHETLTSRIQHYLAAPSIGDLFQRILARYEGDYDRDRPGLVRDAMSAIWSARHGLTESELLDLLGEPGVPMGHGHWSPLYLAAEHSLVNHAGVLGFFHEYLREAVRGRYLPTVAQQRDAHLRLAGYFGARDLSPRKLAELPWQLAQGEAWERLAELLGGLPFLKAAWAKDPYEVRGFWGQVVERIPDAPLKAYQPVFDNPTKHMEYLHLIGALLRRLNFSKESLVIQGGLLDLYDRVTADHQEYLDPQTLVPLCLDTAANYRALGDQAAAKAMVQAAVKVGRSTGHLPSLAASLGAEAVLLFEEGKLEEAMALSEQAEPLARELDDKTLLTHLLNNKANLVMHDDPKRALALLGELETLLRELGDRDTLSACIGTQANALMRLQQFDAALHKLREQEELCRDIGARDGLQSALLDQALLFTKGRDWETALKLLAQQEAICRSTGEKKKVLKALWLRASLLSQYRGEFAASTALAKDHEQLCRELDRKPELAESLWLQADILARQNDHVGALIKLADAERIWRELNNKQFLTHCLAHKAALYEACARPIEAIQGLKEAEPLFRELKDFEGLARAIFDQARIYSRIIGMPAAALPGMRQAEELAAAHGLVSLAQEMRRLADTIRADSA